MYRNLTLKGVQVYTSPVGGTWTLWLRLYSSRGLPARMPMSVKCGPRGQCPEYVENLRVVAAGGGTPLLRPAHIQFPCGGGVMAVRSTRSTLLAAGILLGIGLGGFVDGIVLHQIRQWHHMVTEPFPPDSVQNLQLNTLGDGLFHAFTWLMSAVGIGLLWRASKRPGVLWSTRALVGALAIGWGLSNLVEGIVDRHLLGVHHVRSGPDQLAWDLALLAFGAVLVASGWMLTRPSSRQHVTTEPGAVRGA